MASSRWKRFAFFDRHTLSLPSAVVSDLDSLSSAEEPTGRLSGRVMTDGVASSSNVSMVVTTASLPTSAELPPANVKTTLHSSNQHETHEEKEAMAAMWSSLTACTTPGDDAMTTAGANTAESTATMMLPSQQESLVSNYTPQASENNTTTDGLVLAFVASSASPLLHCVDVTVRCRPSAAQTQNNKPASPSSPQYDLDGWRGYYHHHANNSNATHGIVGLATCRYDQDGQQQQHVHVVTITTDHQVILHINPHWHLSCRLPLPTSTSRSLHTATTTTSTTTTTVTLARPWNESMYGRPCVVDMIPGHVAVGTDTGMVVWLQYDVAIPMSSPPRKFHWKMTIPPPQSNSSSSTPSTRVTSVQWSSPQALFVGYHPTAARDGVNAPAARNTDRSSGGGSRSGICCFELPTTGDYQKSSAPSARHDLDARHVESSVLCDVVYENDDRHYMVARPDGLYTYSKTQKSHVSPMDGTKHCMCVIPSPHENKKNSYALVASTDVKSGRDAVDVYDAVHKLVVFHVLLSPGHKALGAVGMTTMTGGRGSRRKGRSSAIVMTSGGSIVTLTEKDISEKVSLLVQKNLYSAAISMAYTDPTFQPSDITALYRRHAEHLYRKGDFSAAMDQYIYTIGALESSHVIFRYLDAPRIPLLAKYLEELRSRELATPVHNELLRTCYLKLNDNEAAEKIAAFASSAAHTSESATCLVSSLAHSPKDALATVCSLEAPQAAESLVAHGAALARAFPRETAGLVVSLCVGTYSPSALRELTAKSTSGENVAKILEHVAMDDHTKRCDAYPVHLFAPAFVEHPKMLRLILSHCNRNKCHLTPSLRRTMLELTLVEWNQAKRSGDTEAEKSRRKEAIAALTDAHCRDIGDYDALVIVQLAAFAEGELLLYERLQMTPMLLTRYAQDGGDRARRHMLAMCRNDPEILADVLGHFVSIASEKIDHDGGADDASTKSEEEDILDDVREALAMAKSQGFPPVRIARILAGEGVGQFSADTNRNGQPQKRTVPLSVALDYAGAILDDSRQAISRLKAEVEEYNQLCNSMEAEIASLLSTSTPLLSSAEPVGETMASKINIDELYARMRDAADDDSNVENTSLQTREAFWREMNQSDDRFDTIARFYAKGLMQ